MRKVSLRNIAAHKVRLVLTVLSVVLGTAFVAGSFVFTDTLQKTFDSIFEGTAQGVDVRVSAVEQGSSGVPVADVDTIRGIDGVTAVAPAVGGQVVLLDAAGKPMQNGGAPSVGSSYLPPDEQLGQQIRFVAGTPPEPAGQVALNETAAKRAGLGVGDDTRILTTRGWTDVTLAGIYALDTDTGGYVGVLFTDAQARQLFTDGSHVGYIDVAGEGV